MTGREVARPAVGPRVQTIMGAHKGELQALLRTEKAAGRIGPNHSEIMPVGRGRMYAVKVVRLADPPPRWKRRMWVGVGGVSTFAVLSAMVWHARYVLGTIALVVAGVALLYWLATRLNHSGACAGLHCSGCKG
jgi:hypothetical protein